MGGPPYALSAHARRFCVAPARRFGEAVARAEGMCREAGVPPYPHVLVGHKLKTTLEFIKANDIDLLVIGFMGHSALCDPVIGSTCQSLVRLAPCTVLVVK